MTIWTRDRIKEVAVILLVGLGLGFGIGRRRYINRLPKDW